jgi:NDP-sugar pyrophosphorylase family protein
MKAVLLAGGHGKRLRPLTNDRPKAMVGIAGIPIVDRQIRWLKNQGIESLVILASYMKERLVQHVGDGSRFGIEVSFSMEEEPLGTGGALKNAEKFLEGDEQFIMANGDIITDIDIRRLSLDGDAMASISLVPLKSPYGIIESNDGKIMAFREKPVLDDHWINAGIYLMSGKVFGYLPQKGDMEKTVFPEFASMHRLNCTKFDGVYWRPIDTMKDVDEANAELQS